MRARLRSWLLKDWVCPFHTEDVVELPQRTRLTLDYEGLKTCPHCHNTSFRRAMPTQVSIRVLCGQRLPSGEVCGTRYSVGVVDGEEVTTLIAVL